METKTSKASDTVQVKANKEYKKRSVTVDRKRPFFYNKYTFRFNPETMAEKNTKPSNTVPGMVEDMKDMFKRFQMGNVIPINNLEYGEEFGEEVNPMYKQGLDLTDLDNIKDYIKKLEEKVKTKNLKEEKEKTGELSPEPVKQEKEEVEKTS